MILQFIFTALTLSEPGYAQSNSAAQSALNFFNQCVASLDAQQQACLQQPGPPGTPPYVYFRRVFVGDANVPYEFGLDGHCTQSPQEYIAYPAGSGSPTCFYSKIIGNTAPTSLILASLNISNLGKRQACEAGSIINLDSRSVGEQVSLSGLPYSLSYQSHFDPSRLANRNIQVKADFPGEFQVPRSIKLIGRNSAPKRFEYPPVGSIDFNYNFDFNDLISRSLFVDSENIELQIVSAFDAGFSTSLPTCSTGTINGQIQTTCNTNQLPSFKGDSNILSRVYKIASYKPEAWGLGGWTLTNHHYYDPVTKTIFYGFGLIRNVEPLVRMLDPYGTVFLVADPSGSEVYVFDQFGRHLETRTSLIGAIKYRFTYLADSKLNQIVDQNDLVVQILRDSSGRPTEIRNSFGVGTKLELNSAGKLSRMTGASGAITEIGYLNGNGLMNQVNYPSGLITTFSYTAEGLFLREDKNTGGFQFMAESFENLKKILSFSTSEGVVEETVEDRSSGSLVRTTFDAAGGLVESAQVSSDESSELILAPESRGTYQFQNDLRFGSQVQFLKQSDLRITNAAIFSTSQSSVQNVSYTSGEGPFNLASLSETSTYTFPNTVRQSVFNGSDLSYSFLQDGVLQSKIFFDHKERISKVQSPGALDLKLSYNSLGQLIQVTQGRSYSRYLYDEHGFLQQEIDARNRSTSYLRDEEGKVFIKTLPNGDQIKFEYNASGSLKSLTTPNDQVHQFEQTLLDRVAQYIPPIFGSSDGRTIYSYDRDGRLKTMTKPGGQVATFYYKNGTNFVERIATPEGDYRFESIDTLGRPRFATSPDGIAHDTFFVEDTVVQQSWNDLGTGSSGVVRYALNQLYQVSNVDIDNLNLQLFQEYDELGRITRSGAETYTYTNQNQLLNVNGTLQNRAVQQVVSRLNNNLVTTSSLESTDSPGVDPTNRRIHMQILMAGGTLDVETNESVDEVGNISLSARKSLARGNQLKQDDVSQHLIYDQNNRLVRIDEEEFHNLNGQISQVPRRPTAEYSFGLNSNNNIQSYEHFGKRTQAHYGAQDRLLKLEGAIERDFEYNLEGTLSKISNCLGEKRFEYDFFGNLKRVILPDGKVISYKVDAFNRRVIKMVNGTVTERYTWYDQTRLASAVIAGVGRIIYVYGSHPIAPSYVLINNIRYKVVPTWKGDIRYIVAEDGTVIQELQYDEYGNTMKDTSIGRIVNGQAVNTPIQPLGFVSGLTDWDTKMIRFGARDYDPVVGRWTAKDPIGFAGGDTNLYSYVGQNPINFVDPSGLAKCTYSITSGKLNCVSNDGSQSISLNAFSGDSANRNNPTRITAAGGPILPGTYQIEKVIGSKAGDFFLDPGFLGKVKYTVGTSRGAFNLHLRDGGSNGCIVAGPANNNGSSLPGFLNDLLIREAGSNVLEVGY